MAEKTALHEADRKLTELQSPYHYYRVAFNPCGRQQFLEMVQLGERRYDFVDAVLASCASVTRANGHPCVRDAICESKSRKKTRRRRLRAYKIPIVKKRSAENIRKTCGGREG